MQVTLNIEAGQMGDTVVDLFNNIPAEKREELALKVLEKWIEEPLSIERDAATERLIVKYRGKTGYDGKTMTDKEILSDYNFKNDLNKTKSSKEIMISEVSKKLSDFYEKEVKELVENSPLVNKVLEETLAKAKEDFPKLVQKAMTDWFSDHIQAIAEAASTPVRPDQNFNLQNRF